MRMRTDPAGSRTFDASLDQASPPSLHMPVATRHRSAGLCQLPETASSRHRKLGNRRKFFVLLFSQVKRSCRDVLLEMFNRRRPWDWQHDWRTLQEPGKRDLRGTCTARIRDGAKHFAGNFAGSQRIPGDKSDSIALAIIHHIVPFTVRKAITILYGNDRHDSTRSLDVLSRDIGQRNQANLSFVSQLSQSFHRRLKRDRRIRNVQLIDVDAIQAQSFEATLNRAAKV